jgi:hypothetical protein
VAVVLLQVDELSRYSRCRFGHIFHSNADLFLTRAMDIADQ